MLPCIPETGARGREAEGQDSAGQDSDTGLWTAQFCAFASHPLGTRVPSLPPPSLSPALRLGGGWRQGLEGLSRGLLRLLGRHGFLHDILASCFIYSCRGLELFSWVWGHSLRLQVQEDPSPGLLSNPELVAHLPANGGQRTHASFPSFSRIPYDDTPGMASELGSLRAAFSVSCACRDPAPCRPTTASTRVPSALQEPSRPGQSGCVSSRPSELLHPHATDSTHRNSAGILAKISRRSEGADHHPQCFPSAFLFRLHHSAPSHRGSHYR